MEKNRDTYNFTQTFEVRSWSRNSRLIKLLVNI